MLNKLFTKFILFAIKSKRITGEQKTLVISALLENIHALPIKDIITFDEKGTILIKGKTLGAEQSIAFLQSCSAIQENHVLKLIDEQIAYESVKLGILQGLNPEMIMFSKAALWCQQERKKLLTKISSFS